MWWRVVDFIDDIDNVDNIDNVDDIDTIDDTEPSVKRVEDAMEKVNTLLKKHALKC